MNYLGLSEKEFRQIANAVAPDGWLKEEGKGSKPMPSAEQVEAVRAHLHSALMMDKKKEYLSALIERLRPEVENKPLPVRSGRA